MYYNRVKYYKIYLDKLRNKAKLFYYQNIKPFKYINAQDIGSAGIVQKNLLQGQVYVIRNVKEIKLLKVEILNYIHTNFNKDTFLNISNFLNDLSRIPNPDDLIILGITLNKIKNSRKMSKIFSSFVNSLNLIKNVGYIDTGHFRYVIPYEYHNEMKKNSLYKMLEGARPDNESEKMINTIRPVINNKHAIMDSRAHRDVDSKHSHLQYNLWFPMHDLGKRDSLEIFPESYFSTKQYYQPRKYNSIFRHSHYGNKKQTKLKFGDTLLFHSQVFHDSPRSIKPKNRLTVEIRFTDNSNDNNYHYRRLFANIKNFT